MALSERAKANIERQTRILNSEADAAKESQAELSKKASLKSKSRADLNIERQTAIIRNGDSQ
jgi:hypothetical protein